MDNANPNANPNSKSNPNTNPNANTNPKDINASSESLGRRETPALGTKASVMHPLWQRW